jgi:phosphotransferase system HPr (HPr) family protein
MREQVHLCAAPLVEGAIAAAVQASVGASVAVVLQEAQEAHFAKQQHLSEWQYQVSDTSLLSGETGQTLTLVIPNKLGLHARPAARFVAAANRFTASMQLQRGDRVANAKSINQVATLGARQGDTVWSAPPGQTPLMLWPRLKNWPPRISAIGLNREDLPNRRPPPPPCPTLKIWNGAVCLPRPGWPLARWSSTDLACQRWKPGR